MGPKPFTCPFCKRQFPSLGVAKGHLRVCMDRLERRRAVARKRG